MLSHENPKPATSDHLSISNPASSTSSGTSQHGAQLATTDQHIWVVTGPAGCGKSTVGQVVAKTLNLPFIEGDEYHSPANVEKMSKDIPLTDGDRWDWLTRLRTEALARLSTSAQGVVVTCSALKRKYRDVIRVAPYYSQGVVLHFIYLRAEEAVLLARVQARAGHYMGASMVHSQFDALEEPGAEETDVISVDVSGTMAEVQADALAKIRQVVQSELE